MGEDNSAFLEHTIIRLIQENRDLLECNTLKVHEDDLNDLEDRLDLMYCSIACKSTLDERFESVEEFLGRWK